MYNTFFQEKMLDCSVSESEKLRHPGIPFISLNSDLSELQGSAKQSTTAEGPATGTVGRLEELACVTRLPLHPKSTR